VRLHKIVGSRTVVSRFLKAAKSPTTSTRHPACE
jgi:hypothetical protein